jgi:hypothetical protein
MPVLRVYRHGVTSACVPDRKPKPPVRTECNGWSVSSIRRLRQFLYTVDERKLTGVGFALTLTVKRCPATHEEWAATREAFFVRLRRMGLIRGQWHTEWQRRGVPHLHGSFYFPEAIVARWRDFGANLKAHWLELTNERYGALLHSQTAEPIYDVIGWNKYQSKHSARGLRHYQRSPENVPEAWKDTGTGRMWGKLGDWPTVEPAAVDLPMSAFHKLRRIVRNARQADARRAFQNAKNPKETRKALRRISQGRGMLKCHYRPLSIVRGVSEWMPEAEQFRILEYLSASYEITS